MESCPRRALLLLLGIAVAVTALAPPPRAISYREALSVALDLYNRESETGFAFRLLQAKPQPEWDPLSHQNQKVHFTIKETTCLLSEGLRLEQCGFKDNGVVKVCYGTFSIWQMAPEFRCEDENMAHVRVRRNSTGRFIKKTKKQTLSVWRRLLNCPHRTQTAREEAGLIFFLKKKLVPKRRASGIGHRASSCWPLYS